MKTIILSIAVCFFLACSSEKNKQINNVEQQTLNEMKQSLDSANTEFVLERDTTP